MKVRTLFWIFCIFSFTVPPAFAAKARAPLQRTGQPSEPTAVFANVDFEDSGEGLKVSADVIGTTSGKHELHIHKNSTCAEKGNAAGGSMKSLGEIKIGPDGKGSFETVIPGLTLAQVTGKAVILDENAGRRIACGIIQET